MEQFLLAIDIRVGCRMAGRTCLQSITPSVWKVDANNPVVIPGEEA
jgi:hypothetical protein